MKNPLQALSDHGQSVWLDFLNRSLITSGELKRLIAEDGVSGLTSNPSIFASALADSGDYHDQLAAPESQGLDAKSLYERLAVRDIQDTADILQPVYRASHRRDGYVSLEVSPLLARDTPGTLAEARRLWQTVARENLMVKVPGTAQGLIAVQQLISEGINVNVTLLFTRENYGLAAAAYLGGLESLLRQGGDLSKVASVASVFISRIDTVVDHLISERLNASPSPRDQVILQSLPGTVANASAKLTYQSYLEILRGDRWQALSRKGARSQRLLWASSGTKNPNYGDVLYVEELIGPDTVNTMPPATLAAFRHHGRACSTLTDRVPEAAHTMAQVEQVGIPFLQLTDKLLEDGVRQFVDAFGKLLKSVARNGSVPDHDPTEYLRMELMKALCQGNGRV
jgi:transaldolase/glucose-6-phosphate isomerase